MTRFGFLIGCCMLVLLIGSGCGSAKPTDKYEIVLPAHYFSGNRCNLRM